MEYLNNKIKKVNRLEKQLEYNFVMALLLVIEQCYLENENITGISSNSKKRMIITKLLLMKLMIY